MKLNVDLRTIPTIVFSWSKRRRKSWASRVISLAEKLDIPLDSNVVNVKRLLSIHDDSTWFMHLWDDKNLENGNKLRTYRTFKKDKTPEAYLLQPMPIHHRQIIARFRCGTLKLAVETGRYKKPVTPLNERLCKFCHNCIENETHFLIDCPMYTDIRFNVFNNQFIPEYFTNLSSSNKLIYIMQCDPIQSILASCIFQMFKRRKHFTN